MSDVTELITENLDIWTSAIQKKNGVGRGSSKKIDLYGIKKLRELILELAVRGKLVPQDEDDEPASVLLDKIAADKCKNIEKVNFTSHINGDSKPYDVPKTWSWAKLPDVTTYNFGKTPSTKNSEYWDNENTGIPWISISDMNHYGVVNKTTKSITPKAEADIFKNRIVESGTIIMSFKLTVGKISKLNFDAYHNEAIISITPENGMFNEFLFRFLPQRALAGNTKKAIMGNTLNKTSLSQLLIPIPPLQEQHRIVNKVDELMDLCDQLEKQTEDNLDAHQTMVETLLGTLIQSQDAEELKQNWTRISDHFDILFTTEVSIDLLKQTILQLAVMGKLVPQNPTDEPASVILENIAVEKERLIKEGKIKKQKAILKISEDKKPFLLPKGWEWEKFENIVDIQSGITKGRKLAGRELVSIPYLRVANVQRGYVDLNEIKEIEISRDELDKYAVRPRDLLITEGGDWDKVGRTATWRGETPYIAHQNHVFKARLLLKDQNENWIEKYLNSSYAREYFAGSSKQTTNLASINKTQLRGCIVAYPPIEEQKRIIKRLDVFIALCDQLKEKLIYSQEAQRIIADALCTKAISSI